MIERVRDRRHRLRHAGFAAGGKFEQSLRGFRGKVIGDIQISLRWLPEPRAVTQFPANALSFTMNS